MIGWHLFVDFTIVCIIIMESKKYKEPNLASPIYCTDPEGLFIDGWEYYNSSSSDELHSSDCDSDGDYYYCDRKTRKSKKRAKRYRIPYLFSVPPLDTTVDVSKIKIQEKKEILDDDLEEDIESKRARLPPIVVIHFAVEAYSSGVEAAEKSIDDWVNNLKIEDEKIADELKSRFKVWVATVHKFFRLNIQLSFVEDIFKYSVKHQQQITLLMYKLNETVRFYDAKDWLKSVTRGIVYKSSVFYEIGELWLCWVYTLLEVDREDQEYELYNSEMMLPELPSYDGDHWVNHWFQR